MHPAGRWPTRNVVALVAADSDPQAARIAASGPLATMPNPVAQHAPRNFRRVTSEASTRTIPSRGPDVGAQQPKTSVPPLHPHAAGKSGIGSELNLKYLRDSDRNESRSTGRRRTRSRRAGATSRCSEELRSS